MMVNVLIFPYDSFKLFSCLTPKPSSSFLRLPAIAYLKYGGLQMKPLTYRIANPACCSIEKRKQEEGREGTYGEL